MKGKRKNIQYFFIYIIMLAASAFLIFGGVKQLMMTQDLKASIEQKKEEKKNIGSAYSCANISSSGCPFGSGCIKK